MFIFSYDIIFEVANVIYLILYITNFNFLNKYNT